MRAPGKTIAIIPVKGFGRGKSRLASQLDPTARRALSRALLLRALAACVRCPLVDSVLVLTESAEVARACEAVRASVLRDPSPALAFSTVLERGLSHALALGGSRAVVIMGDLADVTPADIARLCRALHDADVALAPDAARIGLGGLATRLPAQARFVLGRGASFLRNVAIARSHGLRLQLVCSPGIALDIDTPSDLSAYLSRTDRALLRA